MSEQNGHKELPASPILLELIALKLNALTELGAREAGLPATARLNLDRGCWIIPVEPPSP